jgi:hypothetical protein
MNSSIVTGLASILLLGSSGAVIAGELPFNMPDTRQAREARPQLHRTAHALYDLTSDSGSNAGQVSDLWLFPTADISTVFARYRLIPAQRSAVSAEHLALLTLDGDAIVQVRELTESRSDPALTERRVPRGVDSSRIGTGHAASSEAAADFHGTPAPHHWTALLARVTCRGPQALRRASRRLP